MIAFGCVNRVSEISIVLNYCSDKMAKNSFFVRLKWTIIP